MILELSRYLKNFEPGSSWGVGGDIDWDNSWVTAKDTSQLYISEVGNNDWQPTTEYDALPNVAFAGDFCQNNVDMATVEAAVLSGIAAAQVVQRRAPLPSSKAIATVQHTGPRESELLALRLALLPIAYIAKACSTVDDAAPALARGDILYGAMLPVQTLMTLPFSFVLDWWVTAYDFWTNLFEDGVPNLPRLPGDAGDTPTVAPPPPPAMLRAAAPPGSPGLGERIARKLNELLDDVAAYEAELVHGPPTVDPPIGPSALVLGFLKAARTPPPIPPATAPARPYRRRWKTKR